MPVGFIHVGSNGNGTWGWIARHDSYKIIYEIGIPNPFQNSSYPRRFLAIATKKNNLIEALHDHDMKRNFTFQGFNLLTPYPQIMHLRYTLPNGGIKKKRFFFAYYASKRQYMPLKRVYAEPSIHGLATYIILLLNVLCRKKTVFRHSKWSVHFMISLFHTTPTAPGSGETTKAEMPWLKHLPGIL